MYQKKKDIFNYLKSEIDESRPNFFEINKEHKMYGFHPNKNTEVKSAPGPK